MSGSSTYTEDNLIADMTEKAKEWRRRAGRHRTAHYFSAIFLLFCALLAPATAITSATTSGTAQQLHAAETPVANKPSSTIVEPPVTLIGLSAFMTGWIAFGFTVLTGLTEGLRRIFKYEQKWRDSEGAALLADNIRVEFMASPDKKSAFDTTLEKWQALQNQEETNFFNAALNVANS